jgi:hypothetical protein
MRRSSRVERVGFVQGRWAVGIILGIALCSAGCASQQEARDARMRMAAQNAQQDAGRRVEMEDDGLPAQIAPRGGSRIPDDPSEPWSPNYGAVTTRTSALASPAITAREHAIAVASVTSRFQATEENNIIRQAIAEHEMRRDR